jgi:hypothetical protein
MRLFDRIARAVLALITAFLYYKNIVTGIPGIILLVISAALLLTSVTGICPLYSALGFKTYQRKVITKLW